MFLLDTNVVIAILARRNAGCLERFRLETARGAVLLLSSLVLYELRVGVAGLSVGHVIAHTLAAQGLCGELRLADFDGLELSNLNRVPATMSSR